MKTNSLDSLSEIWAGRRLKILQADLSQFAPYGNGVYGYQKNIFEPIKGDPPQEPNGGCVYFSNNAQQKYFEGFLKMLDVKVDRKDYVSYLQEASNPIEDHYLTQMRIIPKFALRYMANVINDKEYAAFEDQDFTIQEALFKFMDVEKERWGTDFWNSPNLAGKMGGDGDFAREELGFGFMIENGYYDIYRIWSRAWLVTK
ncbi:MAG TPA: hypothetical protein PK357_02210 [Candidatus Pacearchaeota archaeon]|nr:hypothetical protein [Candidatus Pacearchaeota archaeon]